MNKKEKVKDLLQTLIMLYNTNSKYKKELSAIINMFEYSVNLKSIIKFVSSKITKTDLPNYKDPVNRKADKEFWKYIMNLIVNVIKQ